jgi:hypothetical protein
MPPRPLGSKKLILAFLIENIGVRLTSDQIRVASGNASEWGRRLRELRDEQGYNIQSHNDRTDLAPGEYILVNLERNPPMERAISKETRALVLDRDGYTCQSCGAAAGEIHPSNGRPTRLQLGHWQDKSQGGTDDAANLRVLCSVCNEGAGNITMARPDHDKLLAQIRRASGAEQLKVVEVLVRKYQTEVLEMLKKQQK